MGSTARQKKIGISVNTDRNKVGVIIRPSYKAEYVPKYVSEKTLNEFKEEV